MSVFSVITLIFILCVITFTIAANESDIFVQDFNCIPGDTFQNECNSCWCADDGATVFCTYKLCPSPEGLIPPGHSEFKCIPGDLFRHGCYDCRCYDGVNAFCLFSACNTKNRAPYRCENGATKKDDCNLCRCYNGEWACTRKYCVPEVDIFESNECEKGSTLRRACNVCRCIPDVGYACDKNECPPDQPTNIIEDKNCKDGVTHNLGCNVCKCVPGLGYVCENKTCPEAVFVN